MENKEKRMIVDYTVINSLYIGYKNIALAENDKAEKGERYLCCYIESNKLFEQYPEAVASDDFAEIVKTYGERIAKATAFIRAENKLKESKIGDDTEITKESCTVITADDNIEGKVIVIKGDVLRREHQRASKQLYLCTGGFGSRGNARGTAVYCTSLYDGNSTRFERPDVLGTMEPNSLPQWAKNSLEKIQKERNQ